MYVASAVGLLNFVLIVLLVPESLPAEQRKVCAPRPTSHRRTRHTHAPRAAPMPTCWYAHAPQGKKLDLRSANPLGALNMLLGRPGILRGSAAAYFLVWLGNACINSQFGNYVNHLFGWGPQESAPLLVPAASDPRTRTPSLGPEPWPRAKRPRPRQVSSSEIRRRISKPKPQSHAVGLRRSSTGDNFGESEKHEIEQAMSSGGNFEMVDG